MGLLSDLLGSSSGRIACWGFGHTYEFFNAIVFQQLDLRVSIIIDSKFDISKRESGIIFSSPAAINDYVALDDLIIVTIGNRDVALSIANNLRRMGFSNVIWFQDIYEYNLVYWPKHKASQVKSFFERSDEKITQIRSLFDDSESKLLFDQIVMCHQSQCLGKVDSLPASCQYFIKDFFPPDTYQDIFQIGAYDGDTLRNFEALGVTPRRVTAFEPDPENFSKLSENLPTSWKNTEYRLFQKAASSISSKLRFSGLGLPTSSALQGKSEFYVDSVSIDDFSRHDPPSLFIIDCEGFEKQVLRGMTELMREADFALAIAVYHFPADLIDVPFFLISQGKFRKFALRNYSGSVVDTVLYCY